MGPRLGGSESGAADNWVTKKDPPSLSAADEQELLLLQGLNPNCIEPPAYTMEHHTARPWGAKMRGPPVGTPSTLSLRLLLLLSHFMDDSVSSQPICSRPPYHDWHPHPRNITLRWSLSEITCASGNQDWHGIPEDEPLPRRWMCQSHAFPQLCPLEVQAEDGIFALYDRTLQRYGVNPVGMSEEAFDRCSLENERSLFAGGIDVSTQLHLKWLPPGVRYFATAGGGSDQLCRLGLRVKVVVKQQLCQSFPTLRPCSGNGVCRAEAGRLAYR
ncbi:hypothetical protein P4O66_012646 [Electrophorus voltai]|uniref:Uncharacterized protein n=1 Tax=Electrophorus voltai TaxID=2609070 RepID=A0AAD9DV23_9TELE|nr:hypothetical protein P4O66_012646 [Electrophorus voltai]